MTADVSQGQTCDRASPGAGAIQCRLADGSRLFWASPSPVYERLGHRAIAPDRIQGDAVLPHISHTAQSRITFRRSQAANIQPQRRPQPPDSWRSIGSGIPPPVPKTPLDKPPLIQGEGGERSEPGGVRFRRSPPPVRSASASRPPSPTSCGRDKPNLPLRLQRKPEPGAQPSSRGVVPEGLPSAVRVMRSIRVSACFSKPSQRAFRASPRS
ncbi:hypothetical protein SAMN05519104_3015 [Rhizobiales bacterium GAS188]|nr:hypothetical protein SAMN05519104_3015 [Rhizobiales bacterium GAS188]